MAKGGCLVFDNYHPEFPKKYITCSPKCSEILLQAMDLTEEINNIKEEEYEN